MARRRLQAHEHVVRQCPNRQLIKRDGVVIGVFGEAFQLREGKDYLSTTLLEHFGGGRTEQLTAVVEALRAMPRDVKKKDGLLVLKVGTLESHQIRNKKTIKCWHEPKTLNRGYAAIRGVPRDDTEELFERMQNCITDIVVVENL